MSKNTIDKKKSHAFGKDIYLLGADRHGTFYWLVAPRWDCNWYWGFGYVQTYTDNANPTKSKDINSQEHIDSCFLGKQEYYDHEKRCFRFSSEYISNLIDSPRFESTTFDDKESWELSELFKQFYFLKEAAENFGRGSCYIANTTIPLWKDEAKAKEINEKLIPMITARIIEILTPSK